MKNLALFLASSLIAITSFAQMQRTSTLPVPSVTRHEVAGHLGFVAGAINIGADYNIMENNAGIGGYFHYQTEKKDKGIYQLLSTGVSYKVNFLNTSRFSGYLSPGFGIHMVTIPASGVRSESTETALGPVYKIGTLFKISPTLQMGIERTALVNWLNDVISWQEHASYSLTAVMSF